MKRVTRGGRYFRVCDPSWRDALDVTYSRQFGGRWNPPGTFGALYLNATIAVAAANARKTYAGEIATLYDLRPEQRPELQIVSVAERSFIDAVTDQGLRALKLPASYPHGIGWPICQRIAKKAYDRDENGIASRSNADITASSFIGEELAVLDRGLDTIERGDRLAFSRWYPTEIQQLKKDLDPDI